MQVEWVQEIQIQVFQSAINQECIICISSESPEETILQSSDSDCEYEVQLSRPGIQKHHHTKKVCSVGLNFFLRSSHFPRAPLCYLQLARRGSEDAACNTILCNMEPVQSTYSFHKDDRQNSIW